MQNNELSDEINSWQTLTNLDQESLCGIVESLIFISEKAISLSKIREQINDFIPLSAIHQCVKLIQEECEKGHRGIRLMEVAEGFVFRTKTAYAPYIQKLNKMTTFQLPASALEVLSIVAYHGPIIRSEIEKIKGTDCSHTLRLLMEKKLVSIQGKSPGPGNPSLFATTHDFLEFFNLNSLEDLPKLHEIELLANAQEVGDIKEVQDLKNFLLGPATSQQDLQEFDLLEEEIKSIHPHTNFTKMMDNKKSSFDLLEEYLVLMEVKKQNIEASQSFYYSDLLTIPEVVPPIDTTDPFQNSFFDSPGSDEFFTDEKSLLETEEVLEDEDFDELEEFSSEKNDLQN